MNYLNELQLWYESTCNGEWEHHFGIDIGTLDNPGWSVKVDLEGTKLAGKTFSKIEDLASDGNWIICQVTETKFEGFGDPKKLEKIIAIFLEWTKSQV